MRDTSFPAPLGRFPVPSGKVARGVVEAPPSKSHSIRLLVAGALCPRGAHIQRLGLADDILHVLDVVHALGFPVEIRNPRGALFDVVVAPGMPLPDRIAAGTFDLGGSGTGLRLVIALCALGTGPFVLNGDASLHRRPVGSVLGALRSLGVEARAIGADGRLPVSIAGGMPTGGARVTVDATRSSQSVSALLMLGAALTNGLTVDVRGPLVSAPYVDLTIEVVRAAGGTVEVSGDPRSPTYEVGGEYGELDVDVEGDWSAGVYLLAAAAATGGRVEVHALRDASSQADRRFVDVLRAFGAEVEVGPDAILATGRVVRPVDVDLADSPDLAPLVGALACLVQGRSRVRGAAHLRLKESDRIAATVDNARRLGFQAEEHEDGFSIVGGERAPLRRREPIDPRSDHRIAMSFAVAGLGLEGVEIAQPGCVAKTYPEFWSDLTGLVAD